MSPPIKFKLQTIENSKLLLALEVYVVPSMAGQSSARTPDVGKGELTAFAVELLAVVEEAIVLELDVEVLDLEEVEVSDVEEAEVLDVEEVKVLDVEEVELLSEGLDVEASVKLLEEIEEDCDGLTMRSAFHNSPYLRAKCRGNSDPRQIAVNATYLLVFAAAFE